MSIIRHEVVLVTSHKLHNFVLALSRSVWTCKNYAQTFPIIILLHLLLNKEMKHFIESMHERSTRRDRIVLEIFLTVNSIGISIQPFNMCLEILSTPVPPWPLIVHFAPGSHSIKSQDDHLGGLQFIDKHIDVIEDLYPHFLELFGHELWFEDNRVILKPNKKDTLTHL